MIFSAYALRDIHKTALHYILSVFVCAVIHSDNTYHIVIDQRPFLKGNLLEDLTPSIVPDKEIDDPNDKMPEDWDDREK